MSQARLRKTHQAFVVEGVDLDRLGIGLRHGIPRFIPSMHGGPKGSRRLERENSVPCRPSIFSHSE
jgi:hypothetical protein